MIALANPLDIKVFDLVTETGTDPAVGDDWIYTPPANARIQLLSVRCRWQTDATVDNRLLRIGIYDGADRIQQTIAFNTQGASKSFIYYFAIGVNGYEEIATHSRMWGDLGKNMFMQAGDTFQINPSGMKAGDAINQIYLRYKMWIME